MKKHKGAALPAAMLMVGMLTVFSFGIAYLVMENNHGKQHHLPN